MLCSLGLLDRMRRQVLLLAGIVVLAGPSIVRAQDATEPTEPITRVEEDWLLWVFEPNGSLYAPQFHTVMSPLANLDSYYFQVTWNYRELPDFSPGGFQVQSWNDETDLDHQNVNDAELSRTAEIISWTQVLETNGAQIGFSVVNGHSVTWGSFGHPETTIIHDGSLSNLDQYSPDVSIANSWITYGQNRVYLLRIKQVRYYSECGLVRTDSTPRVVYQYTNN